MKLLPEAQRRDEVYFKLWRSLPYNRRIWMILGLLAVGIGLQVGLASAPLGVPFMLFASLLSLVSGYNNIPKGPAGSLEWRPVGDFEIRRILKLHEASRRWDSSAIDITCVKGFFSLLCVSGLIVLIGWMLESNTLLQTIWLADAFILVLPQWVTGVRRILTRPGLIIKVKALTEIERQFQSMKADGEAWQWMMQVSKRQEGEIPEDVKAMVKYANAPKEFLGVQTQVSLNDVKGTSFPYLYCVVLAEPGFGLRGFVKDEKAITEEYQTQGGVELIVVRQRTTRTSGYHTDPGAQSAIFKRSLLKARHVAVKAGAA